MVMHLAPDTLDATDHVFFASLTYRSVCSWPKKSAFRSQPEDITFELLHAHPEFLHGLNVLGHTHAPFPGGNDKQRCRATIDNTPYLALLLTAKQRIRHNFLPALEYGVEALFER